MRHTPVALFVLLVHIKVEQASKTKNYQKNKQNVFNLFYSHNQSAQIKVIYNVKYLHNLTNGGGNPLMENSVFQLKSSPERIGMTLRSHQKRGSLSLWPPHIDVLGMPPRCTTVGNSI